MSKDLFMKKKTNELVGAELDYAVAKAEGIDNIVVIENTCYIDRKDNICKMERYKVFNPHDNWTIAGPIIEREKIKLQPYYDQKGVFCGWGAGVLKHRLSRTAQTPLIAAMRGHVAHNLGEEVEIYRIEP